MRETMQVRCRVNRKNYAIFEKLLEFGSVGAGRPGRLGLFERARIERRFSLAIKPGPGRDLGGEHSLAGLGSGHPYFLARRRLHIHSVIQCDERDLLTAYRNGQDGNYQHRAFQGCEPIGSAEAGNHLSRPAAGTIMPLWRRTPSRAAHGPSEIFWRCHICRSRFDRGFG